MYVKKPKVDLVCLNCKEHFLGKSWQKYCSEKCRVGYFKYISPRKNWGICTGTVGALHELKVSIDLLSKGYDVYRALSPSSKYDLVVTKGDKIWKVEVTTGYVNRAGGLTYPLHKKNIEYLAICLPDKIIYKTPLD